jgi:hypothetical protein
MKELIKYHFPDATSVSRSFTTHYSFQCIKTANILEFWTTFLIFLSSLRNTRKYPPRYFGQLLMKDTWQTKIHKIIILPLLSYWYKTWPLTLGEQHCMRLSENGVLTRIYGRKRDEIHCIMRSFITCNILQLSKE